MKNLVAARDRIREVLASAGIDAKVPGPFHELSPGSSFHYGGSVRMHANPEFGVLDRWNRMYEVPNVAVVDPSSFPTGPEKNPTLTAMALAGARRRSTRRRSPGWRAGVRADETSPLSGSSSVAASASASCSRSRWTRPRIEQALAGTIPRPEYLILKEALGADLYDFTDVAASTRRSVIAARRYGPRFGLAALGCSMRKRYDHFYCTGEDIALPFGMMMACLADFGRITAVVHNVGTPKRRGAAAAPYRPGSGDMSFASATNRNDCSPRTAVYQPSECTACRIGWTRSSSTRTEPTEPTDPTDPMTVRLCSLAARRVVTTRPWGERPREVTFGSS